MRKKLTARNANGQRVKGRWQESTGTPFEILASVQPTTPNEIESLPENRRESISYTLYSRDDLVSLGENENPDQVQIEDAWYEVTVKNTWKNGLINHNQYVVTKI